jgi:formate dehydrogenase gamma subunit
LLRHPVYTRILHWTVALFFFLALFTGFGIYLPWLFRWFTPIFGGGPLSRIMHPYFGVAFVFFFSLQTLNWLEPMIWTAADSRWMRNMKKIVSGEEKMDPPDTGFFNAGQKLQFWEIVGGCVVYLITGIILWAGARAFGRIAVAIKLCHPRHLRPHHAGRDLHPHLPEHVRRARHLPVHDSRRRKRSLGLDLPPGLVPKSYRARCPRSLQPSPPENERRKPGIGFSRDQVKTKEFARGARQITGHSLESRITDHRSKMRYTDGDVCACSNEMATL